MSSRVLLFLSGIFFLASCASPKKTVYFKENIKLDTIVQTRTIYPPAEAIVQPDDILAINVTSISSLLDKNVNQLSIYNSGGTPFSVLATSGSLAASGQTSGFLVDAAGNIDFPIVGKVKVAGFTIRQVKEIMVDKLDSLVKNPVVEVRIINYKVTILGEVVRPGAILAPNQKINIIDALAAAGDSPLTGRRDNILVIRETAGRQERVRLNLNSSEVFNSPYYYLHQNDVVYVEPIKLRRLENNEFIRFYLPVISSVLSTGLAVYGIIQLANK